MRSPSRWSSAVRLSAASARRQKSRRWQLSSPATMPRTLRARLSIRTAVGWVSITPSRCWSGPESMRADVVIVGGGVIGSSVAYHLAAAGERSIIVIERDPSYAEASSALSASSIRQQFTTPACIRMSQYGFYFLKHITEYLDIGEGAVNVSLTERGYLYLADATYAPA